MARPESMGIIGGLARRNGAIAANAGFHYLQVEMLQVDMLHIDIGVGIRLRGIDGGVICQNHGIGRGIGRDEGMTSAKSDLKYFPRSE
jgi:hypothetical protein